MKTLESYITAEQDEQVKKTKKDLDDRVAKLMKHIQQKSQGKQIRVPIFDSELIELINDFQKKYQTLYSLYEHLKGQVSEQVYLNEDENESSSSSSLDSFHSSYELEPCNTLQQFEDLKNECCRLSECLVKKDKELKDMRELILELETASKEREENLSNLLIKLEENEFDLMWKSEELMEKTNELQLEVDAFWQGAEMVHLVSPRKSKSESSLLLLNVDSSGFLLQLELLKAKFDRKNMDLQKIVEEKKGLEEKVKSFEKQTNGKIFKDAELGRENEDLRIRVAELQESLNERNHDIFVLEAEFECLEDNSSAYIKTLKEEITSLQEALNEKEEQYMESMSKFEEHRNIMRGKGEAISKKDEVLNTKDSATRNNKMIHEKESEIMGNEERMWKLDNDKQSQEKPALRSLMFL